MRKTEKMKWLVLPMALVVLIAVASSALAADVVESFQQAVMTATTANKAIQAAAPGTANMTFQQSIPNPNGFSWGARTAATTGSRTIQFVGQTTSWCLQFQGAKSTTDPITTFNVQRGSYAFTIFDTTGGNNPNKLADLSGANKVILFQCTNSYVNADAAQDQIRYLIRDNGAGAAGNWWVSATVRIASSGFIQMLVSNLNTAGWYPVTERPSPS